MDQVQGGTGEAAADDRLLGVGSDDEDVLALSAGDGQQCGAVRVERLEQEPLGVLDRRIAVVAGQVDAHERADGRVVDLQIGGVSPHPDLRHRRARAAVVERGRVGRGRDAQHACQAMGGTGAPELHGRPGRLAILGVLVHRGPVLGSGCATGGVLLGGHLADDDQLAVRSACADLPGEQGLGLVVARRPGPDRAVGDSVRPEAQVRDLAVVAHRDQVEAGFDLGDVRIGVDVGQRAVALLGTGEDDEPGRLRTQRAHVEVREDLGPADLGPVGRIEHHTLVSAVSCLHDGEHPCVRSECHGVGHRAQVGDLEVVIVSQIADRQGRNGGVRGSLGRRGGAGPGHDPALVRADRAGAGSDLLGRGGVGREHAALCCAHVDTSADHRGLERGRLRQLGRVAAGL